VILINTIKYIPYFLKKLFKKGIKTNLNKHDCYETYVKHQKIKTTDTEKIQKWLNEEWQIKYEGFKDIFERNRLYIKDKKNALCLESRTGQEVKALQDLGLNAIGVDLVAFPPYTEVGDIHYLKFNDGAFDFIFTNIMDHSLYPEKFIFEMERVCKTNGVIIIHLQLGENHDEYTETILHGPKPIVSLFNSSKLLVSKPISNLHDQMHWEIILKKII